MKNSIRMRLFLQVALIVVAIGAVIMLLISQFLGSYYIWNEKRILTDVANHILEEDLYTQDFKSRMAAYESKYNMIIDIYYDNNISIYTSFYNSVYQRPEDYFMYRPQRMPTLNREMNDDGSYFDTRQDQVNNSQYLVFHTRDANGYNVEIYVQKDVIHTSAELANRFIFIITVAALFAALIWAYFFSRHFTKPLIEMNEVTRGMADMDFTRKCAPETEDELGQLGNSINHLSDSLDYTLRELQEKNARLEQDIEKERNLEKTRREFIANVSHELKTPIAIIQGYAEGLQVGVSDDPERLAEYADIIMDEAKKMNQMVYELLELSKYGSGHARLSPENFNIRNFTGKILENHALRLDEFEILAYNDVDETYSGYGDVSKLEQVLNNYISNAVSHCKSPKRIVVSCADLGSCYRLGVFNTGDRIPVEEMERIWGSFYRSDKAHSREQGRVGLGLSIVSAIQELHGLGYGVQNCQSGVRFWFDIKKSMMLSDGHGSGDI